MTDAEISRRLALAIGWKLVPVEPTQEMIDAANLARKYREHGALTDPDVLNSRTYNSRQTYAAMLSASPAAPQPAQADADPLQVFVSPRAKALMQAFEEGWRSCADSEYIGKEAQNDAFNQSRTVNHCIAEDTLFTQPAQQPLTVPDGFVPQTCPHCTETWLMEAQQPLLAEKDALLRQALDALEGFANITNDSQGVAGYHLSGDTAEWDEFDEVDAASSTIEALRNHLGVKND